MPRCWLNMPALLHYYAIFIHANGDTTCRFFADAATLQLLLPVRF